MADAKLRLDPNLLTPRDLKRAKVVLDGRNPFDLLGDPVEAITLTVWCLRSRTDPAYTWDQAEDTPLGEFDMAGEEMEPPAPPPPTAGLVPNGDGPGRNGKSDAPSPNSESNKKPSSATSSA